MIEIGQQRKAKVKYDPNLIDHSFGVADA